MGRRSEFIELRNRLVSPETRFVTVTGSVGVGKSRLAAAVFEELAGEFTHGGFLVDLSAVHSERELGDTLAALFELGGTDGPEPTVERLADHLRDRHFLLVLDGCDQLRGVLGPFIGHLVKECAGLSALVTGQERLGVYGEDLLRLDPLPVPMPGGHTDLAALEEVPSVRLFVQRTRMVRPNFVLTEANQEAVSRLCVRTDGLPMAIEFAAARMKLLSPHKLLAELEEGLDSLSGADFDTLSQNRGMRDAIERSLSVLGEGERAFLARLALFHGEFDFAAADGVSTTDSAETQRLLEILLDKSLLSTSECPDGDMLIAMLGLTRQYLREELGEDRKEYENAYAAHAAFYLTLAERAELELLGADQGRWLERIDHWLPGITGVLRFLREAGDGAGVVRIVSALRLYWQARGMVRDGIRWLSESVDSEGLTLDVAAKGERALGELLLCTGEWSSADSMLARARSKYEELGDSAGIAGCMRRAGLVAFHRGDLVEAERQLEECVAVSWIDCAAEHAEALRNLAECRRVSGDAHGAGRAAEDALEIFRRSGDTRNIALSTYVWADATLDLGDQTGAIELYQSALGMVNELDHVLASVIGLERFAILLTRCCGRSTEAWRRAAHALGAAAALRAATRCVAPAATKMEVDSVMAETRVRLGDEGAETLAGAGARLPANEAVAAILAPMECTKYASDWDGTDHPLTRREYEVAELVAGGLTNREIARRLGIAEWTAVNHLRKIMRKLACSSRVQVASWVTKRAADNTVTASAN
ncbi:ATP-binding protein [Streptomyces sp. NPDC015346]|uniref:ATP-binding protein n=1 Tax=Streptomyces sp. NPDC015346 TaxID=3364954 RepID=UPI0036F8A196